MPDSADPLTSTSPLLGSSRLPAIASSVLLPEPLGPMTATSSPPSTARSISRRACTRAGPDP
jgi:hypothetical protein